MGRKLINREGQTYKTEEGYILKILKCYDAKNYTIIFSDGTILHNVEYAQIKRGNLHNPNHPNVCGVGYYGIGKYNYTNNQKIYTSWQNMIKRCYNEKIQEKQASYKDVIVCEEWKCFQNFAEWYEDNYNYETMQGWHIDKDILVKGNKIYSPETCCFVPLEINSLFVKNKKVRGGYPIGIHKYKKRFVAQINKRDNKKRNHIGVFDTPEEAFQAYKVAKESRIKEVAEEYKDQIDPKVYEAMINWKVEITD